MGAVRITSLNPKFNGSHFGLPPSSILCFDEKTENQCSKCCALNLILKLRKEFKASQLQSSVDCLKRFLKLAFSSKPTVSTEWLAGWQFSVCYDVVGLCARPPFPFPNHAWPVGSSTSNPPQTIDGDLAESIKRSASDRLGDLVP